MTAPQSDDKDERSPEEYARWMLARLDWSGGNDDRNGAFIVRCLKEWAEFVLPECGALLPGLLEAERILRMGGYDESDYIMEKLLAHIATRRAETPISTSGAWVSVKERLPEPWVEVLVWHIIDDHQREIDIANVDKSGAWCFPWIGRLSKEEAAPVWVTHWMPVPAAPLSARQERK